MSARDALLARLVLAGRAGPDEQRKFLRIAFGARSAAQRPSAAAMQQAAEEMLQVCGQGAGGWGLGAGGWGLGAGGWGWGHAASALLAAGGRRGLAAGRCSPAYAPAWAPADLPATTRRPRAPRPTLPHPSPTPLPQESGLLQLEERVLGFLLGSSAALKRLATVDDLARLLAQVRGALGR